MKRTFLYIPTHWLICLLNSALVLVPSMEMLAEDSRESGLVELRKKLSEINSKIQEIKNEDFQKNGSISLPPRINDPIRKDQPRNERVISLSYSPALVKEEKNIKLSSYYLGFNIGPTYFCEQDYLLGIGGISLDGGIGIGGTLNLKKNLGNFHIGTGLSYYHKNHSSINAPYLGGISFGGSTEIITNFMEVGYQFRLSEIFSFIVKTEFGVSFIDTDLYSVHTGNLGANGTQFNWGAGWVASFNLSLHSTIDLGYKFNMIGRNSPLSTLYLHSITAGFGYNF
jgi:hypothetical protein